jgi:hypothetical protein
MWMRLSDTADSQVDLIVKANDSLPPDIIERYWEMGSLAVEMVED